VYVGLAGMDLKVNEKAREKGESKR